MAEIDDRVVSMHFDNASFEKKIAETLKSLATLQKSLDFTNAVHAFAGIQTAADKVNLAGMTANAEKGFGDVQSAADRVKLNGISDGAAVAFGGLQESADKVNLSQIAAGVDNISSKFSAMGVIGFTAIQNLTTGAFDFLKGIGEKALDPILGGGKRRAENIEQAKFQFRGLGLDVEKAMASALEAVQGTAFGLDEAAKTAAQFGASGIKVGKDMTAALRGIAGAAAMTGKSFTEISDVYTSSAGSGLVNNQDLMQFATRGLNAAAAIAPILHVTEQQVHEMASAGELDFKTFAAAMDEAFGEHATKANETYSGSLSNMRAAFARLGAAFFGPKMVQMRDLFNTLTPVIDKFTKAFKPLNDAFLDITRYGTDKLMWAIASIDFSHIITSFGYLNEGIRALYNRVTEFIRPIQDAFREIFPKGTSSLLETISKAFRDFMWEIQMAPETIDRIKRIFAGLFALLEIGWVVLKSVGTLVINIFRSFSGGTSKAGAGLMSFTATLGDFLVKLNSMLVEGGKIHNFFDTLGKVIVPITRFIGAVVRKILEFFFSFNTEALTAAVGVLGSLVGVFSNLFTALKDSAQVQQLAAWFGEAASAVSNFFGSIDFVGFFNSMISGVTDLGSKISGFLSSLSFGGIVSTLAGAFVELKGAISDFFSFGGKSKDLDDVNNKLDTLHGKTELFYKTISAKDLGGDSPWETIAAGAEKSSGFLDSVKSKWEGFLSFLGGIPQAIGNILEGIKNAVSKLIPTLSLKNTNFAVDFQDILDTFNAILLTGFIFHLAKAAKKIDEFTGFFTGFSDMLGKKIDTILGQLGDTLKAFQAKVKAEALKAIAIGMAILVASLFVMSTMDTDQLLKAFAAMTTGFIELVGVMKIMDKMIKDSDKIEALSKAMQAIATSMLLMALALKVLGSMSIEELGVGMLGMTGALTLMVGALAALTKVDPSGKKMIAMGIAMIAISVALLMMAGVIATWAQIPTEDLVKGMTAVGLTLAGLVAAVNFLPADKMLAAGAAMIPLAIGLTIIAGAVALFGNMDFGTMMKGIFGVFVMMALLAGSLHAMPEAGILMADAAALVVVGVALNIVAKAVETMGKMGLWELIKGLAAMGLILLGLTTALDAMEGALPGAQALLIASAALLILSVVMEKLGAMKLWDIIKALGAIAGVILVLGLAAYALSATGAIVALEAMALALLTLGAAMALMGVGAFLFVAALVYMVNSGKEHLDEMIGIIGEFISHIPELVKLFAQALVDSVKNIVDAGKQIVDVFVQLISDILDAVIKVIPKVFEVFGVLISSAITFLSDRQSDFIAAGFALILALLQGMLNNAAALTIQVIKIVRAISDTMAANAPQIVSAAVKLIVAFISALDSQIDYIVGAGLHLLISFLLGIYNSIQIVSDAVTAIIVLFISSLANMYQTIIDVGAELLVQLIIGLGQNIKKVVDAGAWLIMMLMEGIARDINMVISKGVDVVLKFLEGLGSNALKLADGAATLLVDFLYALSKAIDKHAQEIHDAGVKLATSIVEGIAVGLLGKDNVRKVVDKVKELAGNVVDGFKEAFGINSPAKAMFPIGAGLDEGLALSLDRAALAKNAAVQHAERVVSAFSETLSRIPDSLGNMDELNPVITPVLDLTKVQVGAKGINNLMAASISPDVSFGQATQIASTTSENNDTSTDTSVPDGPTQVSFVQNNYSPKALSTNDIYRNQKSQFALAKEELNI